MSNRDINQTLEEILKEVLVNRQWMASVEKSLMDRFKDIEAGQEEIYKASAWTLPILLWRTIVRGFKKYILRKKED